MLQLRLAATLRDHFLPTTWLHVLFAIPLLVGAACLFTWLVTTIQFRRTVAQIRSRSLAASATATANVKPIAPPVLPYVVPWLGSALAFLNENPGSFWTMLRSKLAETGASIPVCTILLGGQKAHVVSSAAAVQALFKSKHVSRDIFNHQLATKALGSSQRDAEIMFPPTITDTTHDQRDKDKADKADTMEALNHEFLLNQSAVNALTKSFFDCLQREFDRAEFDHEWKSVHLFTWLKRVMFNVATTAVLGSTILKLNPNLAEQFWDYEAGLLARFYGVPRLVKPEAYACLDVMLDKTQEWLELGRDQADFNPADDPEWEPLFGSKVVRARHRLYERMGLTARGKAAFDLGFLFGLQSNAVPITCWLLAHLFSPMTPAHVLPKIQTEIKAAQRPNGEIDIAILSSQPLLNSALHETMRQYVDSLVTRQLNKDMIIDGYLLKKNDLIMAPSSLSQHDPTFWEQEDAPSADSWYAERFLKHDDQTGRDYFSTSWTAGKFFPFGGGTQVCPGRVFAKQEILGALAAILSRFDIKFVEFAGTDKNANLVGLGKGASGFPKVKRQYAGNGTLKMDGDICVQIRRK
ncbi:hypothetical protein A1O3_04335 [Capronia epimyces CBS 606.96]|uniref:Cytochrome P450 oxidoreductase n=1 Tax=Capronia epimyces CBS 606.96 TaxID=1182542 RepID=W9YDR7_9EURO|nr:uncharacterized protein A1O3_04335 [Capronia epimyces CBS 606.96]EXJ87376.1 hypothetical protein A1O3_04335 [Capronia epimyces CBS 606.96]